MKRDGSDGSSPAVCETTGPKTATPPLFQPFPLRGVTFANRVFVSPMCQYSAVDGTVDDWHLVHLGSRAVGGAGLVMTEMTNVSAEGRITPGCAGMYGDAHEAAWKRVVDFVHARSASRIGIQLAHAHPDVPVPVARMTDLAGQLGRRGRYRDRYLHSAMPRHDLRTWHVDPRIGQGHIPQAAND